MTKNRIHRIIDATTPALPWIFGTVLIALAAAMVLLAIRVVGEIFTAAYIIAEIIFGT